MSKELKLTEEELKKLREATDSLNKVKLALGNLEVQKLEYYGQINALTQQFNKLELELIEKYGKDSVINIQTGEVKKK